MRLAVTFAAAALLFTTAACNSNESVASLAGNAAQLSELLPRVAAVPYNACIDQHLMQQSDDDDAALPDRPTAANDCKLQALERDRLTKLYGVLTLYFDVLGRLASGRTQSSEKSVKGIAAFATSLNGADSARQAVISGLAGAIATAYLHGRSAAKLREAIAAADPHVQALSKTFATDVVPGIMRNLKLEEEQLQTLFQDSESSGALRLLLLRQFDGDQARIAENRNLVNGYASVLGKVAAAHAKLFANRDRLNSRDTIPELLAASDAVADNLKAFGK